MSDTPTTRRHGKHRLLKALLPLLILALGVGTAFVLLATKPQAQRATPEEKAPLVRVAPARAVDRAVSFDAMGTVVPAREITLRARVAGHVQSLAANFTPGGLLKKGQDALDLDPEDYRLAVRRAETTLADTRAALDLEMGQQRVAKAQLDMLAEASEALEGDTSLALREPQLAQARAAVDDAEAALEQARLNLARTRVRAPFNALVTGRSVDVGSEIGTSDTLATLVGTDEYWIEAAVPLDRLRWMEFAHDGGQGSPAAVIARSQTEPRAARVLRLAGSLVESSRMAQVIISVPHPLDSSGGAPLQLDEFVTARITGKPMTNVVPVPRSALREGDKVWICGADNKLDVRKVTVAWSEDEVVYVSSGIKTGELVVTTDVAGAVHGMVLRIEGRDEALIGPKSSEAQHVG